MNTIIAISICITITTAMTTRVSPSLEYFCFYIYSIALYISMASLSKGVFTLGVFDKKKLTRALFSKIEVTNSKIN